MKILVTGGAGFIGSAVVRHLIQHTNHSVVNVDKLTYAAGPGSLDAVAGSSRYAFEKVDICDAAALELVFATHRPDAVMHLAAESHVDRSIDGPAVFIETNIVGTTRLLDAALSHFRGLAPESRAGFRFHHVSTDEVFGSLGSEGRFDPSSRYDPRSPYSASKAASDHLAKAWHHTYGLPVVISNSSNNYGPYQFPEKLIPLMIIKALHQQSLPVYGDGESVRDWLFVEDHARALVTIAERGRIGATYMVGGDAERRTLDVVEAVADLLDEMSARPGGASHRDLITFVADRPGHDARYAVDASMTRDELGWRPSVVIEEGLRRTVAWYLERRDWWEPLVAEADAVGRVGLGSGQGRNP